MRGWLLILALSWGAIMGCGAPPPAPEQSAPLAPVVLTSSTDRSEATVGDIITWTLTLSTTEGLEIELPRPDPQLGGLAITDIQAGTPTLRDGRRVTTWKTSLRADLTGSYVLPEVKVEYKDGAGQPGTAAAPRIFLEVKSVLKEGEEGPEQLADIQGPIAPPRDWSRYYLAAGALAALAALGGLAYHVYRRHRDRVPPPPPPPPWVLAHQEFEALLARGLLAQGAQREHFFALSEILRRYIERRFGVPALEETSEEILHQMRRGGPLAGQISQTLQVTVQRFLLETDRVKYASHVASEDVIADVHQACLNFIDGTTPVATPPPQRQEG